MKISASNTKSYNGFTYNANNSSKDVEIAGDGTTIINVYYDRVLCTVNFYEVTSRGLTKVKIHTMTVLTKKLYPGVPYFLLGHSMGSFYARQYLCEWGSELDGAIILGTGFQPKALVAFARTVCRVLAVFFGWQHRSRLVAELSFLGYNKGLEGRTTHDWLNRDHAEVDKYLADERCTFTFTLNAYYSMFTGILRLYGPAFLARMPKDLPVLFLAGDADPVGERSAGVRRAVQSMKDAGMRDVQVKFYPGARHELLVETNRAEVFADIGDFVERHLP